MKLQLALDRLSQEDCFSILQDTEDSIDWIEIGTGVIKQYGMEIVRSIKRRYPRKTLVADMKTCDAGKHESDLAFSAGADVTTVMAFSAERTIEEAMESAARHGGRVMIDLLNVADTVLLSRLAHLGADLYSLHRGKDMQSDPSAERPVFSLDAGLLRGELAVAGGTNATTLPTIMPLRPDIVIVGEAITRASSPGEEAARLKEVLNRYESALESGS